MRSGKLKKEEAMAIFNKPSTFDTTKLGAVEQRIMKLISIRKMDRKNFDKYDFKKYRSLIWILAKLKVVPYTFYIKYCK